MSISINGLGSGFDIDSWVSSLVSIKKSSLVTPLQTKLSTLKSTDSALSGIKSKYNSLQSSLKKFTDTMYGATGDMWNSTSVTTSDSSYVTASASGLVNTSKVDVRVERIATETVAKSAQSLGTDGDISNCLFSTFANNQAKGGTFSLFLNNKKYEIQIDEDDTLDKIKDKINLLGQEKNDEGEIIKESVLNATIIDGKFTITPKGAEDTLVLGSTNDTSNILSALKLYDYDSETHSYSNAYPISRVNTDASLSDPECGIGGITFSDDDQNPSVIKINGVEFSVDENTSINNLISKINNNTECKVKASYDSLTNQFILTSLQTGKTNIALEEKNTNLLYKLGLTDIVEGEEVIRDKTQTLGENALVYINNNPITSNSNTINSELTGIKNLSITVKKPMTGAEGEPESVSLNLEADYSKVKSALKSFVSAYNDVVSTTKNAVSIDGSMAHDSSLSSILSSIRSITTSTSDNEGEYTILSQIGITTSSSDPTQLTIDDTKLDEALKKDFESVKLLLSDGYMEKSDTGLFDKLMKNVNTVLDVENGYFTTKSASISSQMKLLDSRIERANTQLTKYETRITEQFNRMDSIMSQLSSQLSTFQAYLGG